MRWKSALWFSYRWVVWWFNPSCTADFVKMAISGFAFLLPHIGPRKGASRSCFSMRRLAWNRLLLCFSNPGAPFPGFLLYAQRLRFIDRSHKQHTKRNEINRNERPETALGFAPWHRAAGSFDSLDKSGRKFGTLTLIKLWHIDPIWHIIILD